MPTFRKKPVVIEAVRPSSYSTNPLDNPVTGGPMAPTTST